MVLGRNVFPESAIKCNQRTLSNKKKKWWGRKVLGPLGRPKKLVTDKVEYQESRWEGRYFDHFFIGKRNGTLSIFTKLKSVGSKYQIFSGGHIFFEKNHLQFF